MITFGDFYNIRAQCRHSAWCSPFRENYSAARRSFSDGESFTLAAAFLTSTDQFFVILAFLHHQNQVTLTSDETRAESKGSREIQHNGHDSTSNSAQMSTNVTLRMSEKPYKSPECLQMS